MNHNLKIQAFVEGHLLANITTDPSDVNGPLPAEGALAFFDAGVTKALDLAKKPGAIDKTIDTALGTPMLVREFLMFPFLDMTIHSWDLAKGSGQAIILDPGHVEAVLAMSQPGMMEGLRKGKVSGPEVSVAASASAQDRMLGIWGRQP